MITKLRIDKLFGTFDYDLLFSSSDDDKIRFITAPNGYGKSTILRLIDGIFNHHLEVFFKIPYKELLFTIDSAVLKVCRFTESSIEGNVEEAVRDDDDNVTVKFAFGMPNPNSSIKLMQSDIMSGGSRVDNVLQQIEMFFSSETCKYIDDRRLLREDSDSSELVRLAGVLADRLVRPNENTEKQVAVLQDIVRRSDFVNKYMEISPKYGFRFVANNETKKKLAMSDLSSGEQHIMLISLYMLFDAPEKAIILIDEPEMSFHLSWQGDYLRNLSEIVKLRNVQCIIATHSPHVFNSDWDMSVDLYELSHPVVEE